MNNHALPEQKEMAMKYRNVGLGIMGLYDMLVKLGIKYGTGESIEAVDEIMNLMFKAAFSASVTLAKEKGSFPACKLHNISKAKIVRKHFTESELHCLEFYKYGIRNCSLLSIAPSGSIGTMLNISTGCEPAFALSYTRKTESLNGNKDKYYEVYIGVAKEYMDKYPGSSLPDYFITSADLDWHDRVNMQSVLQEHVDTAISSTINLKNEITKEEIEDLYLYAWEKGLKGVTIFRDGCKRAGILTTGGENSDTSNTIYQTDVDDLPRGYILKTTDDMPSFQRNVVNGCGDFTIHLDFDDYSGKPYQSWIDVGDGGCERNLQFISRLISLCLRSGVPLSEIIRQAKKIRPCPAYQNRTFRKGDTSKGSSCPSAIGFALEELQEQISDMGGYTYDTDDHAAVMVDVKKNIKETKASIVKGAGECPECGSPIKAEGGCLVCTACGWSKCD